MKIETIKKLPNILSMARILSVPVVLCALMLPGKSSAQYILAAVLFVLSAATDSLDGHIARKYDAVTNFGKFIDPVADKLLVVSVMIWIAADCAIWWVTLGTILTAAREFVISAFRLVAATQGGKVIAAGWLGKIKTVLQDVALTAYILHFFAAPAFMYGAFCVLFALSAVMTVWSCADYIVKNREVLMEGVR